MRISLWNKYDHVSVICTYFGSSVENRICCSRHPEMTFHLSPSLCVVYIFVCRCVCSVITSSQGEHTPTELTWMSRMDKNGLASRLVYKNPDSWPLYSRGKWREEDGGGWGGFE